jgi:hypothetical protein
MVFTTSLLPNAVYFIHYLDETPLDRVEVGVCVRAPDVMKRLQAYI